MNALFWYGIVGYFGIMLLLAALLGAQRGNERVARAHIEFKRNIDILESSPVISLARAIPKDDE